MDWLLEKTVISCYFCSGLKLRYLSLIYTQKRLSSSLVQMIPQLVLILTIEGCHNKSGVLRRLRHVKSYSNYLSDHPPLIQVVRKMYFGKGFAIDFQCSQLKFQFTSNSRPDVECMRLPAKSYSMYEAQQHLRRSPGNFPQLNTMF